MQLFSVLNHYHFYQNEFLQINNIIMIDVCNSFFVKALPQSQFCFVIIKNKIMYKILKSLLDCLGITLFILLSIYIQSFLPGLYMIYLTSWGCLLTSLYFLFSLIYSIQEQIKIKFVSHTFLSICYIIAFCLEFLITIMQWCVMYTGYDHTLFDFLADGTGHIFPMFLLVVDLFENKIMVKSFKILIFPYAILIIYLIFNAIYTLKIAPIYIVITFTDVWTFIFVLGALFLIFTGFLVIWLFSRFVKSKYEIVEVVQVVQVAIVATNHIEGVQDNQTMKQIK